MRKLACSLGRIGMLAGVVVPFLAAQTVGRHAGEDVRTLDLLSHPESKDLANAREAFRQGDIIRIVGGRPEDLQRLLDIGGATVTHSQSRALANNALNAFHEDARAPVYQVVAARATRTGALHEFQQLGTEAMAASSGVNLASYETWAEKERRLAQKEEAGSLVGDPAPPAEAWTELQETTLQQTDQYGNLFQNTLSVFRLNDISLDYDWYMVLTVPESQPDYQGCTPFFGTCGWWTHQRVFTMATNPQAVLFDHGPLNQITSENASFSIGGSINATGPGVTAGYTATWQQPSVTTTDQSDLNSGVGKWNEAFTDEGAVTKPPETSIGLFKSHQGSIFQVPEGTTSFQFTLDEPVTYYFQHRFNDPQADVLDLSVQINIFPPVFTTSLNNLSIPPGGSGTFEITAVNPSSGLGLAWDVKNLPQWLTVSQTSGSGSARITLNVAPGTALGTVASINVNTNPEFAAPSVEVNPLLVRVTVGQPNNTGVLLAGGNDAQARIQNVADLYSPQLGQFDFEATMQSPRTSHTATLLLSGELLLAGGSASPRTVTATAELFDPDTAQFSSTAGMMTDSRELHTATLLQNGTVLLAGGIDNTGLADSGDSLATAELYDPNTGTFAATGSMAATRANHSSTALLDGEVLVAGGQTNISLDGSVTNTAEIYDPNTGRFTPASGNLVTAVFNHTATRLKNGHVLIAGGFDGTEASAAAELYNPGTRTFSAVGNLNVARIAHTATLLADGTVLIAGGQGSDGKTIASAELYNPETQIFTLLSGGACPGSSGCMITARSSHSATLLLNGTVLIACGSNPSTQSVLGSTEIYNPQTRTFSAGPSTTPKTGHTATLLQRAPATVALTSSSNPSTAGQRITLTATVATGDRVAPTGFVAFEDGTDMLANVPIQAPNKGVATFSLNSLTVGPHNLTAKYSGDTGHGKSASNIVVQIVKSQATTTTLRSSPNPSNDGQLVTFVATVTPASPGVPTGSVTFRNNGASLDTVRLIGNTATYQTSSLPPGSNAIIATYDGDSTFGSSGSQVLTQNVAKLPSTVGVTSSPNPASFGQGVLIRAAVTTTGNSPGGFVDFRDRNTILQRVPLISGVASFTDSNLSVGPHSITGTYNGDSTHAGAVSAPVQQQITADSSAVSLRSSLNPSIYGQNVTFTATVTSSGGVPSGTVTFSDSSLPLGTGALRNGVATFTIGTLSAGIHPVSAAYSGDARHTKAASSPLNQTVNKVQTSTVLSSAPNPSRLGQAVIFRATVSSSSGGSPTGIVTLLDDTRMLGQSPIKRGIARLTVPNLASGPHNITASYGGNSNFAASVSPVVVQTVAGLVTPTVALTVNPNIAIVGATVTFRATVRYPGGPVPTGTITISDVADGLKQYGVAPLNNGVAVIRNSTIPIGSYNLVATYGGDDGSRYNGATSNSVPVRIVVGRSRNVASGATGGP
jgi:hypothetical protein